MLSVSDTNQHSDVTTMSELENMLGFYTREIRSIKIPVRLPTLPGKEFEDGEHIVTAFSEDGGNMTFLHIKSGIA